MEQKTAAGSGVKLAGEGKEKWCVNGFMDVWVEEDGRLWGLARKFGAEVYCPLGLEELRVMMGRSPKQQVTVQPALVNPIRTEYKMPQELVRWIGGVLGDVGERETEAGLLYGRTSKGKWILVVPKQTADAAEVEFEDVERGLRVLEEKGARLVGTVHTHPGWTASPSGRDKADLFKTGMVHWIVGRRGREEEAKMVEACCWGYLCGVVWEDSRMTFQQWEGDREGLWKKKPSGVKVFGEDGCVIRSQDALDGWIQRKAAVSVALTAAGYPVWRQGIKKSGQLYLWDTDKEDKPERWDWGWIEEVWEEELDRRRKESSSLDERMLALRSGTDDGSGGVRQRWLRDVENTMDTVNKGSLAEWRYIGFEGLDTLSGEEIQVGGVWAGLCLAREVVRIAQKAGLMEGDEALKGRTEWLMGALGVCADEVCSLAVKIERLWRWLRICQEAMVGIEEECLEKVSVLGVDEEGEMGGKSVLDEEDVRILRKVTGWTDGRQEGQEAWDETGDMKGREDEQMEREMAVDGLGWSRRVVETVNEWLELV